MSGEIVPFEQIQSSAAGKACLLDTNVLIAYTYYDHVFADDAGKLLDFLIDSSMPVFVSTIARMEFLEFHRRANITKTLMDTLQYGAADLKVVVQNYLEVAKEWIDEQKGSDVSPVLPDNRIKSIRDAFSPNRASGKVGWLEICAECSGFLDGVWEELVRTMSLNHAGQKAEFKDSGVSIPKLEWEPMVRLIESTQLSASDAMIVNLFAQSNIPFLASMDRDVIYAFANGDFSGKTLFAPQAQINKMKVPLRQFGYDHLF